MNDRVAPHGGSARLRQAALVAAGVFCTAAGASAVAADVAKGQSLYMRHCASCHGQRGTPVMPGTPNLSRPETLMRSDAVFVALIANGRGAMPGFRGMVKDAESLDIVAYMRTLLR